VSRPDHRAPVRLPALDARERELETCTFCPKLCRSACPVSNAEPRETLTPWGKMSLVNAMAHGDVPVDAAHGEPAWACTGCGRCQKRCDHEVPVGSILREARAELTKGGVRPAALEGIEARVEESDAIMRRAVDDLAGEAAYDASSRHAILVGCSYHRGATEEARLALRVVHALTGERHRVVSSCCGAPLADAGLPERASERKRTLGTSMQNLATLVVVDAGCAQHMIVEPAPGLPKPVTLVELAARHLDRFSPAPGLGEEPVRWHDPCRLGRGLGQYDEPRHVLARILARSPDEFAERREQSGCSGAGGLVPLTFPEAAKGAAKRRVAEHDELGGGRVITGCASSLRSFRAAGADADDIVRWMAKSLGVERA
jgi:Fe-S oxidoreductase